VLRCALLLLLFVAMLDLLVRGLGNLGKRDEDGTRA
jgi:hypothetical protein